MIARGLGSGIVLDTEGRVLTCHHVVRNAEKLSVTLHDGRTAEATLLGSDPRTNLAVIQIEAPGLVPISWGDSEALYVGQFVIAVGAPYELRDSVSLGIVSALHRTPSVYTLEDPSRPTPAAVPAARVGRL